MIFFHISSTDELAVIGHYPQTKPSQDKRGHFDGYDSKVRMYHDKFPDFIPKYGIDIHQKAIATDIISRASLSFGLVVSERFKTFINDFKIPPHRFYEIDVFGTNKKYYWFHYITDIWSYIDFENTEIEVINKFKFNVEEIKTFKSFEEIMNFDKNLPRQNTIRFGSIQLRDNFPNYDLFEITGPQHFTLISEKLKQKSEEENITGFEINQYGKIKTMKEAIPYSKNDAKTIINWIQLISISDSLQTASGQTYGKNKLKELVTKLNQEKKLIVEKEGSSITISSKEDLQKLINSYDPNIILSEIV